MRAETQPTTMRDTGFEITQESTDPILYARNGAILSHVESPTHPQALTSPEARRNINRVFFVSWRLPVEKKGDQTVKMTGGLAHAAMDFFASNGNGSQHELLWVGCLGAGEGTEPMPFPSAFGDDDTNGVLIDGFTIKKQYIDKAYRDKANGDYWPMHHGRVDLVEGHPEAFQEYTEFNKQFARRILKHKPTPEDFIWIHDYQLQLAAGHVREMAGKDKGKQLRLGYFHHIPHATPEQMRVLPKEERKRVLRGLLAHNIVGFQTEQHMQNFIDCVAENLVNDPSVPEEEQPEIHHLEDRVIVRYQGRDVLVRDYPISINPDSVAEQALSDEALEKKAAFEKEYEGQDVMLHVSRADYTKNYVELGKAFRHALRCFEELRYSLRFGLVLAPGRALAAYDAYEKALHELVTDTNREFQQMGDVIKVYGQLPRAAVLGAMSADVTEIHPMASNQEGMGLTIKEAAMVGNENAVYISTTTSGSYQELAPFVEPIADIFNEQTTANVIYDAHKMPLWKRHERRNGIKEFVNNHPITDWFNNFMDDVAKAA